MPGSRSICFVCGSHGAELKLQSKPREKGPYFPFLDHHEPPKGCRQSNPEGVVDSCRVCYAFLTQQWETYERSQTPALKRLYWLKRTDELTFTGAEMKLQGEYMAQVMGLQYQPNCHDNCSSAPLSPDDRRQANYSVATNSNSARKNFGFAGANLLQDGSSCGGLSQSDSRRITHSDLSEVQLLPQSRTAEAEGVLDLSVPSKSTEPPPQNSKSRRSLERSNATRFGDLIVCFTCGSEMYVMNSKLVSSVRISTSEPYFPFLGKLNPLKGAVPLSKEGLTRVCESCFASAYQQWIQYERACTPTASRIYKIKDKYFSDNASHSAGTEHKTPRVRADEACYLCGQMKTSKQIVPLYTVPPSNKSRTMHFPFIGDLRRPHGAQPLNPDGTVLVCLSCNGNLKSQWDNFERESVPLKHRRYSLLPIPSTAPPPLAKSSETKNAMDRTESSRASSRQKSAASREEIVDISQPLNIQISKSPVLSSTAAHGLLAIAPQTPRSLTGDVSSNTLPSAMIMSEMAAQGLKGSDLPRGAGSNIVGNVNCAPASAATVPHPLQQAATLPKKVCFLCGENCLPAKSHLLFSYPLRHEAKSSASVQSVPFFPFLANKEAAPGSESMTDEGTVIACNFCHFSLLQQWKGFEDSKNPADSNRWLRKYSVSQFVCYVCGQAVARRRARTLEVPKFDFLKDHKAPAGSLVMDGGEKVMVCDCCSSSLTHQFSEHERMGVPNNLRKYRWSAVPLPEDNSQDVFEQGGSEERWRRTQAGGGVAGPGFADTAEDGSSGLGQGGKVAPTPLSLMSPSSGGGGGKMTPKTAAVPPLSQASPSNGLTSATSSSALNATRTMSFAAALHKLAHQAKDPQEEAAAAAKHNGSPINSSSPRSSTPKRGPQTQALAYAGQTSTLNSPPVVTIAPTQTVMHITDGRQSNDRVPSAHSTTSSYDHYNVKHERDQRPQSSHSREDDRGSAKDAAQTPTRMGLASTSAAGSREDSLSRGFHPYRPEDDLHRAAASAALLPQYAALDPAAYAAYAAYHPAFMQHHQSPAALRGYEDPLMERLRMMQAAPFLPFHAGMVSHPGMHPLLTAGARYPPELLHQFPYLSPGSSQALDARTSADRSKSEDERAAREFEREKEKEKEKRERERERERDREAEHAKRERLREAEREKQRSAVHADHRDILTVPSAYLGEREGEKEGRAHHSHSSHHNAHSARRHEDGKGGSIRQGTPRETDHSRPRSRASEGSHEKNHYLPTSQHNHYHSKYDNHTIPKQERPSPSSSSHHSYHPPVPHNPDPPTKDKPPPLVSPHRSSSKSAHDSAIFRPFEKDLPNDKQRCAVPPAVSLPPSEAKFNHVTATVPPATVRVFGSTPEAKIVNSNFINHRVEKFDFKSLAREFSGEVKPAVLVDSLAAPLPPTPVVEPVSRLDARERLIQEARLEGWYDSDTDDECRLEEWEERRRDRLTVIDSLSPAPLELSRDKLALLSATGLTTRKRKSDLIEERIRKRRRALRQPSVSPIEIEEEEGQSSLSSSSRLQLSPLLSTPVPALPGGEISQEKNCYLSMFGLKPTTPEHRKVVEMVQQASAECRHNREARRKAKLLRVLETQQRELLESLNQAALKKLRPKEMEMTTSAAAADSHPDAATFEPLRITLGQLQERHLVAAREEQEKNLNHSLPKAGVSVAGTNKTVIFPETRGEQQQLNRQFAEKFYESVLQSTKQKEHLHKSPGAVNHSHPELSSKPLPASNPPVPSTPVTATEGPPPPPLFPWPGIEAVLESYNRHRAEQQEEGKVLRDRCRKLQSAKQELNKTAESLTKRLQALEEEGRRRTLEREHLEMAIGNLKQCLTFHR